MNTRVRAADSRSRRAACKPSGFTQRFRTLSDIVTSCYAEYYACPRAERAHFQQLSLEKAIEPAACCLTPAGKRHPHQYRLKQETLDQFASILLGKVERIRSSRDFADLYAVITDCRIYGIGELTLYDVAHRISLLMGVSPTVVYLHAGTRAGAKKLGIDARGEKYLPITAFYPELQKLPPADLEDILCLFKDQLGQFAP